MQQLDAFFNAATVFCTWAESAPTVPEDEVDTAIVSSADYGAYLLDTVQTGPDREAKKGEIPPIAYSGDDWTGDLTAASTVTFTSPSGTATVWNKVGNGADTFTFNANGVWTVTLAFADGTTETAKLDITTGGTTVILR